MDSVEYLVIGAGVVGLAIARALTRSGREVVVLERERVIGSGVSSRNSEVIHAGVYYPSGLEKTRLCVEGKAMLYSFCREYGVPHRRCGKLLVATSESEIGKLAAIKVQAEANGVADLAWLAREDALALEPALAVTKALLSPSTGIIDSHAFMLALQGDAERRGAMLALETPAVSGRSAARGLIIETGGRNPTQIAANVVINSAGLGAQALARSIAEMPREKIPPLHLAKGNYFILAAPSPFSHLIYPVPAPGGLGIHLTLDISGRARFGPDVEWIEAIDYAVDPRRGDAFYAAVRSYWPGLPDGSLQPDYSGIRPKIERPGGSSADFLLQGPKDHGVAGLVNLFGIESPGLTASLAIADRVAAIVQDMRAAV
jgi:L-2-hydroxyglutarate oxidase LhgO